MKDTDFLIKYDYAHRGQFNNEEDIPENSLEAFKKALISGYGIELDVQAISDGTLICFHDDNLARMTNIKKPVYDFNYQELSKYNLLKSKQVIPKFEDVLKMVDSKVPLLIEIKKHKNYKNHLNDLTKILDTYKGKFAVFSFDPFIVRWFKVNKPSYIRGQISSYFYENNKMPKTLKYLMKDLAFNRFTKPDFISYNIDNLPNKYVDKFRNRGGIVFGYTARNQDEYNFIKKLYDNVVFESFVPIKK